MAGNHSLLPDEEDWRWEREAEDLRHQALDRVRDAASKWTAGIAVLLALVSVSGFVSVDAMKEVPEGALRVIVICGIAVATALIATGAVFGSFAAQGAPRRITTLDGAALRSLTLKRATKAAALLLWSRIAVTAGLAVLAFSGTLVLIASQPGGAKLVITDDTGAARCGQVEADPNRVATVAGQPVHTAEAPVVVVERC